MTKFIDTNIFIERWGNERVRQFTESLNREENCTSVLVLTEVYHKLSKKKIKNIFEYVRAIMGAIKVHDILQEDLFNAMKNPIDVSINDKIHIAVMKRNKIQTLVSFDGGFDQDKTIEREEP